jgi:HAD superfamily hydrolase (TIGR01509 family)
VDALLVDLYDTIVWGDWPRLSGHLAGRLGVDIVTLRVGLEATHAGRSTGRYGSVSGDLAAVAEACGMVSREPFLSELVTNVVGFLQQNVHLYDDVLPVLRRLRSSGTRVALVSNCDHATRPVVDALGLEREVDSILLSCEVGSAKPDAGIFLEALRRLQATAEGSVFVDDQPCYLDGAATLGIRTLRIVRDPSRSEVPEPSTPPVISDLAELRYLRR